MTALFSYAQRASKRIAFSCIQIQISYKIKSDSTSQKETVLPVKDQYKYETLLNSLSPGNTYVLSVFASSNGVNSEMQTVERTTSKCAANVVKSV